MEMVKDNSVCSRVVRVLISKKTYGPGYYMYYNFDYFFR